MLSLRAGSAFVALALAVLVPGGCGDDTKPKTTERTEQIPMRVTVELDGDLQGKVEDKVVTTQLVVMQSTDPKQKNRQIYAIETVELMPVGSVAFTAGFGIRPYAGPGKYEIETGSIHDPPEVRKGKSTSSAKVLWKPDVNAEEVYDYYRREEPCAVVIEEAGRGGEITCPRLTNEQRDKHFSLRMTWQFA